MATKSRSKATTRAKKATVVSNKKSGTAVSWLNKRGAGLMAVLAVVFVGAATLVWTQAATTTHTLFGSTVPKNTSINDSRGVELGVKFRAKYTGQVTGVRFYKSALNTGTHVGNLWTTNGKLLATATFKNETKTGWQQVKFSKPVNISANTTYIASYYAPKGHFVRDTGFFKKDLVSGPLTGMKSGGVAGKNGVYRYGSKSTYPVYTSGAQSNYGVDVIYTTSRFSPTPKPAAPTGLKATASTTAVALSWKASPTAGVVQYNVLRNGAQIGTVPQNILNYNDTKVTQGTEYSYTVVAVVSADLISAASNTVKVTVPKPTTPTPTPPTPTPPAANGPRGKALYVDPRLANDGRPAAISGQPYAVWIGGWSGDPAVAAKKHADAATAQGKIPTFVLYNIPLRDCGLYSAGGLSNFTEYQNWINGFVNGLGQREAIVILEPDALAGIDCLNAQQKTDRLNGLKNAVNTITGGTKAHLYIDAGNATWIGATEMANRLKSVGVDKARGFAVNTSNFYVISQNVTYGTQISNAIGGAKPFVIDTSRNGQGPWTGTAAQNDPESWCNPPGRGLGVRPTTTTNQTLVDAYLWVKTPGESDGECTASGRISPPAGQWYQAYAEALINNANYNAR